MELVFLTSDDIVKAHYALHGNIEPEVNTSALIKVCIIVSRTYAGVEASLETVFQVAADYGKVTGPKSQTKLLRPHS